MLKRLLLISSIIIIVFTLLFLIRKQKDLAINFSRNTIELTKFEVLSNGHTNTEISTIGKSILVFNRTKGNLILLSLYKGKIDTIIKFEIDKNLQKELTIKVDYIPPYFYFFQPRKNRIVKLHMHNNKDSTIYYSKSLYTRGTTIGENNIILKEGLDSIGSNEGFIMYQLNDGSRKVINSKISKIHDGGLGSDGFFSRNINNQAIFTTYYTNEVFVFDDNSHLKTISPIGNIKSYPKVVSKRKGLYSLKEIETAVNENGEIYQHNYYILSNLQSKNGNKKGSYIDIYDITTGLYVKSYFIKNYEGKRVTDFAISDGNLLTVQNEKILKYDID